MTSVEEIHKNIIETAKSAKDEADYVTALVEMGMDEGESLRAFRFTQIAWARSILTRLKVKLVDEYVIFDEAGKIGERGKLSVQSWFASAARDAGRYEALSGFQTVAAGSSEFDAVNKALRGGSKAEDLMMTPVFMFATKMSPKAVEAAHLIVGKEIALLQQQARAQQKGVAKAKPWWRFW